MGGAQRATATADEGDWLEESTTKKELIEIVVVSQWTS